MAVVVVLAWAWGEPRVALTYLVRLHVAVGVVLAWAWGTHVRSVLVPGSP